MNRYSEKMMVLDSLQRPLHSLRVSVTDRCNFRCAYCMPVEHFGDVFAFKEHEEILRLEEIERLVRLFVGLGVEKVRLTGGEPLMRRGLLDLVAQLRAIDGLKEIALTTNASMLASLAEPLRKAGLDRVSVSLDTLDPDRFRDLAGTKLPLGRVLGGIQAAQAAGFAPIKLNCVLQRGVNDGDILPLVDYAREQGLVLRFIEFMDVGTQNGWKLDRVVPSQEVRATIEAVHPLEVLEEPLLGRVAQRFRYRDGKGELGLISSVSSPFCGGCDRARLSADGRLYTCLFASGGMDLKAFLRGGSSDEDLRALLLSQWSRRDDRYSELRGEATVGLPREEMFRIGG